MIFKTIGSAFKQAFKQVFRNRAMTLASLFSITAMLLILGFVLRTAGKKERADA